MARARTARKGQTITIIDGPNNGEKAIALEDAGNRHDFRVRLTTGPRKGDIIRQRAGDYVVGG